MTEISGSLDKSKTEHRFKTICDIPFFYFKKIQVKPFSEIFNI